MKKCSKCGESKDANDFYKCKENASGLRSWCKQCDREKGKRYIANNREKIKTDQKLWRVNNKEYVTTYGKQWRAENKEKIKQLNQKYMLENQEKLREYKRITYAQNKLDDNARSKAWRTRNPEKLKETLKLWVINNKHKKAAINAKRRARKLQATPKWANFKLIDEYYETAAGLSMHTGILYVVDHIIPLQGKSVCGLHVENNLQVITAKENSQKHNKFTV